MDTQFLIADDSDGKIIMLEALIQRAGYKGNILVAKTTDESKRLTDLHPEIAYAFVDYEMPSENGIAVISYLRKKSPDTKIALVTASNNEEYKQEAEEAGANGFVCTSFAEEDVAEEITDLLLEWLPR